MTGSFTYLSLFKYSVDNEHWSNLLGVVKVDVC